ncbi:MAG: WD40 repeat domain-containing protein [Anaerolineae bacterium]
MSDVPRQSLKRIVQQYGPEVCDDHRRCEALLRDFCGDYQREIFVLVSALEHGIVSDLRAMAAQLPLTVVLPRLAAELRDTTALSADAALWAVSIWAEALALGSESQIAAVTAAAARKSLPETLASTQRTTALGFQLAQCWTAHEGEIADLAFSPDGHQLASVGIDTSARIWDVASCEQTTMLKQQTGILTSVAWRLDGLALALGSGDTGIYLWPWTNAGAEIPRLRGHRGEITGMVFVPGSDLLASSSRDATLRLWDAKSGRMEATLAGHREAVLGLAVSDDGRTLASAGGWDRNVRLWDVAQAQELWTLSGHTAQVTCVRFGAKGALVASGGWDETVRLWNPLRGDSVGQLVIEEEAVHLITSIAISPAGATLAAGDWQGEVRLWDLHRRTLRGSLSEHGGHVRAVDFSPGGRWLASADDQGKLCLWRSLDRSSAS